MHIVFFQELGAPFLGVLVIRIMEYWGPFWDPFFLEVPIYVWEGTQASKVLVGWGDCRVPLSLVVNWRLFES